MQGKAEGGHSRGFFQISLSGDQLRILVESGGVVFLTID
jgi:hypothetical protein